MSQTIRPLNIMKSVIPELDFMDNNTYVVLQGCQDVTYRNIIATSYSNSSATFTAPPPSPNTAVCRKVYLECPVKLTFSGVSPDGVGLLQSGYDAFRAFPLASIMESLTIELDGLSQTIQLKDVVHMLTRYNNNFESQSIEFSTEPCAQDISQNYNELQNSNMNPLKSFVDSDISYKVGRGCFNITSINNGSGQNALTTLEATLNEALMLSPLYFGCQDPDSFIGLQTFQVTINWSANLARLWSHDNSSQGVINNISVELQKPTLHFQYVTPPPQMRLPRSIAYSFYPLKRYVVDFDQALTAGNKVRIESANIQLNSIPKRMYIAVRRRNLDSNFSTTDTFFKIHGVSINWNNRSGILSSATQLDLYNISKSNGINYPYPLFNGDGLYFISGSSQSRLSGIGSVIALEWGRNIPLHGDESPGKLGTYQLQLSVDVENLNQDEDIIPALYMVTVEEGVFSILKDEMRVVSQVGVISTQDILDAIDMPVGLRYKFYSNQLYGGDILQTLKDVGRKVLKTGKDAYDFYKKNEHIIKPMARLVFKMITGMGYEGELPEIDGAGLFEPVTMSGGALPVGGYTAMASGGARMSKSKANKRFRRMLE